jgi:esterase/lipase
MHKLLNAIRRRWLLLLISGIVPATLFFILKPRNLPKLVSYPHPAEGYASAARRAENFGVQGKKLMNPLCRLEMMSHKRKTSRAVILVHGYTSCPKQFHELGKRFFELGDNVLIAPLPHHGLAYRLTEDQARLGAEELAAYADEVVDIARGLGDRVVMMGISAGGVTTAWAAQYRSDIDLAVIISPAFGFKEIPVPLTAAVMNMYSLLPDSWSWWDENLKENVPPAYAYPRYSRRALTEILRLGFVIERAAVKHPPAAKKIVMVFNPNDGSISNERTLQIVKRWKAQQATVDSFTFDASLNLGHDIIDPNQPDQKVDIVYPKLIELCGGE